VLESFINITPRQNSNNSNFLFISVNPVNYPDGSGPDPPKVFNSPSSFLVPGRKGSSCNLEKHLFNRLAIGSGHFL